MSRTPQRTLHQPLTVTSGDVISGDSATGGAGGALTLEGGTGSGTNSAGGTVTIRQGLPSGSGTRGIVNITNNDGDDSIAILQLSSIGTNGGNIRLFVGTRDPNGAVSANPGDLYVRHNGTSSSLSINTGATDGNSTWTNLSDPVSGAPAVFDTRSSPTVTGSALSGGGTVDFTIVTGLTAPLIEFLDVTANGNTVSSDVRFYRDAARTSLVYEVLARDAFTNPFVDATPWAGYNRAGDLQSNTLYGRITNNGANPSTYDVRIRMRE